MVRIEISDKNMERMRMRLHVGEMIMIRVSPTFSVEKKRVLAFHCRNHSVFESVFFRGVLSLNEVTGRGDDENSRLACV